MIPLMLGARDMVFPYVNMVSFWVYFVAVLILVASFFVPGGASGAGGRFIPAGDYAWDAWNGRGHHIDVVVFGPVYCWIYDGRP